MLDIKKTSQLAMFSASVGIVDGLVGAGIAGLIGGVSAAVSAFVVVGAVSTVVASGAYVMCMAAAAADEAMEAML